MVLVAVAHSVDERIVDAEEGNHARGLTNIADLFIDAADVTIEGAKATTVLRKEYVFVPPLSDGRHRVTDPVEEAGDGEEYDDEEYEEEEYDEEEEGEEEYEDDEDDEGEEGEEEEDYDEDYEEGEEGDYDDEENAGEEGDEEK